MGGNTTRSDRQADFFANVQVGLSRSILLMGKIRENLGCARTIQVLPKIIVLVLRYTH